jgi:hypothetical protein
MCISIGRTSTLKMREEYKLLYYPKKLAVGNYPVEIKTSSFIIGTSEI